MKRQFGDMPNNSADTPPPGGAALPAALEPGKILQALPQAVIAVDSSLTIRFANTKAEEFFAASSHALLDRPLEAVFGAQSAVVALVTQVLEGGSSIAEHGLTMDGPRMQPRDVTVQAAALGMPVELVAITLRERSIADKLDRQWSHRSAARSVGAMAAMLAHEVRNPLLAIRGAAQLLEQGATLADQELTRLICDETDRLKSLIDRMEVFSDELPIAREPVNIHAVLNHVHKVAVAGFARDVRFVERYDPSLPLVDGNRDQLIRLFLNLVKNAAEALPATGGEIVLATAYQHGMRLSVPSTGVKMHLPLVVTVQDNGGGIPDEVRPHLFDAFVTTKHTGTGLGLALVAKIANDHGGVVEFDSRPGRTSFRVSLPVVET